MLINSKSRNESGFATILMVLLIGLAIAGSAVGTAYYVNSAQKGLVSSHALTNVESGAWTGAETFRKYLDNLDETDMSNLDGQSLALKISDTRNIALSDISVEEVVIGGHEYYVTANIQNISSKSKASSTLQIVYQVSFAQDLSSGDPNSGGTVTFPNAMNFYGNLDANGGIDFSNGGEKAVISVAGDFSTNSGLEGIGELRTTGNVSIGGGSARGLENIYSNGNVDLNASGYYSLVSAKGSVSTSGGVAVDDIYADGDVKIKSSGTFNSIDTKRSIEVGTNGAINKAVAGQKIEVNNGTIKNAAANSDIDYSVWNSIGIAQSGGTFICKSKNWNKYNKISAVAFDSCPENDTSNLITLASGTQVASPRGALTEVTIAQKPMVNAYDFNEEANYAFSVDNQNRIMVYVRQVKGIADGTYYLGKIQIDYNQSWGYLCKTIDSNGFCTSNVAGNFAKKYGYVNEFVTYNTRTSEWLLKDNQNADLSIAPGVLFFEGKVKLTQGNYANTIIATDDIDYGGSILLKAPNRVSVDKVCGSQYFSMPTNLCTEDKQFSLTSIGNIALLSGSCTSTASIESCSATYKGGDISFGSQSTVEGSVIAGNKLESSGKTVIKGPILAAALSNTKGTESTLRGSTSIDFDGIADGGTTITLPGEDDNSGGSNTITQGTKIKWARYL